MRAGQRPACYILIVVMPIYEYGCETCQHAFEELIRNKQDEEELRCPACGGARLQRQMSVFGVQGAVSKPVFASGGGGGGCAGCSGGSCATCH